MKLPEISVNKATIEAVPSIHGRVPFAELAHTAIWSNNPPDAIAVELGPGIVRGLVNWLTDLGLSSDPEKPLPMNLGLMQRNNRVHPRFRKAALRLQRIYKCPLNQISKDVLYDELRYTEQNLVSLSPTDSLIEAVRSAVNRDIPVYGVDMDAAAVGQRTSALIEDPDRIRGDFLQYLERNQRGLEGFADAWVDRRREQVMAARLKTLSKTHERILFVCGMAHWLPLLDLLQDPATPAAFKLGEDESPCQRVFVPTARIVSMMDLFPEIAETFNTNRGAVGETNWATIYTNRFEHIRKRMIDYLQGTDSLLFPAFLRYLQNICTTHAKSTPHVCQIVNVASSIVSKAFANRLSEELIFKAIRWEDPSDWPDLPIVHCTEDKGVRLPEKATLRSGSRSSQPFYIQAADTESNHALKVWRKPDSEESSANHRKSPISHWVWVWPPNEFLLFSTLLKASRIATSQKPSPASEVFQGSLREGVDVRSTLRSYAMGRPTLYVKTSRSTENHPAPDWDEEPGIVLFSIADDATGADFQCMQAGQTFMGYVSDQERLKAVIQERGDCAIAGIQYRTGIVDDEEGGQVDYPSTNFLWGLINYGSPCANDHQAALWLERHNYACCPILPECRFTTLSEALLKRFRISLEGCNWQSVLIRLAIPYASNYITILAPEHFHLAAADLRLAESLGIEIRIACLNHFPEYELNRIRNQKMFPSLDGHGLQFDPMICEAMGENPDRYLERLPQRLQKEFLNHD